jgi:hypothetical protein
MDEVLRIPNIENYIREIINGELVIRRRIIYITENELLNATQITHSTIEECIIKRGEEVISTKKKYHPVLVDIWKTINRDMPVPGENAPTTLKKIINMVKLHNMSINLSIKLKTGEIVHFKI